jgi:hemerythrin superfamily protein
MRSLHLLFSGSLVLFLYMKATDVIARDHRAAVALFEKFMQAPEEDKKSIEHELFAALNAHELMEDTHFYPALKDKVGSNDILDEIEHEQTTLKLGAMGTHVKETVLGPNEDSVEKVMEKVLAHAKKEEDTIFPLAEEVLGAEMLEELGKKMEPMSAVALSEKK